MSRLRWLFAFLLLTLCVTSARAQAQNDNNRIRDLAWSPDGTQLVAGSSLEFVVYNVTGTQMEEFWQRQGFGPFAWSPDGQWLVTRDSTLSPMSDVSEPVIRVWDVEQQGQKSRLSRRIDIAFKQWLSVLMVSCWRQAGAVVSWGRFRIACLGYNDLDRN